MILTVILGLLLLSALVIFHEAGHFWVARALGVRVERFSVGFGPVLFSRKLNGVEFALSAFPLGGYVKMGGDDPRVRENLEPGDFFYASWWRRVVIATAGPGANFVLAVVLSIGLLWYGVRVPDAPNRIGEVTTGSVAESVGFQSGDRIVEVAGTPVTSFRTIFRALPSAKDIDAHAPVELVVERSGRTHVIRIDGDSIAPVFTELTFPVPAEVGEVVPGYPAYKAGLDKGDLILAVNDEAVANFTELQRLIEVNPGTEVVLTIDRGGREIKVPITPVAGAGGEETEGKIGIAAASVGQYVVRMGFFDGIVQGARSTVGTVRLMVEGIANLFSDVSNLSQISGPVAIVQAGGDAARAGVDRLLDRAILFSVALMVFNLLPIPILDGGMIMLSLLEGIRRKPVGEKGLAVYQGIGIAVMGTLLFFVLINDPLRILQRQSALGRIGDMAP